ncbi:MAG: GNAT family N-acetyltransferase [Aestuariivirga sp.]|uniref:GNAT family N-acetyltransferase n=1 Tax=Aestuariivirga sp. TaxID=2650926 RepID=UPI0025C1899B|nr:GNAT family N-acetyltransferase [Aestuariivirga sp.]MCA3562713.1 GNAT family N-acetyltransferase [Aestuariivirga sp.]
MTTIATLPAVETQSLLVREIELGDAPAFCNFMTQDAYQRHIAMRLASEQEVRAFVTRCVARQGGDRRNCFHLAAEEKLSGEAIGDGFLILQHPRTVEIGWGLHPAMWGMGLGTEIGQALLGLAFERLRANSVWCKVMDGNAASSKLAQRIGLRHLKTHPHYPANPGRRCRVDFYAMDESDYFNLAY